MVSVFVQHQHDHGDREQRAHRLGERERLPPVDAIDEDAGRDREEQPRQQRQGRDDRDEERVVGQPRREQRDRDPHDAVAQARRQVRGEDVAERRAERLRLLTVHHRSCTPARIRRSYKSCTAASNSTPSDGSAPADALATACSTLRAPGMTVVMPGSWASQPSAATEAGRSCARAKAANSRAASTPVSKSTPANVSPTSNDSPCRL